MIQRFLVRFGPILYFVSACADAVGPPSAGIWVLERADGTELPLTWSVGEATWTLLADTLVLSEDRRFSRRRAVLVDGVPNAESWEGDQTRDGDAWTLIDDVCATGSLALCLPAPRVREVGSDLELRQPEGRFELLLFRRR